MPEPRSFVDRPGPGIFDALHGDPSLYFDRGALKLLERDQTGFSHRFLRPFFRVGSRLLVAAIVFIKRLLPFEFSNHDLLDRLGVWFLSRFVSSQGGLLLLRHFIVETNVIAFIARNTGLTEPTLRPTSLDQLTDNAVVVHDLNVYELLAGLEGKDLYQRGTWPLDYSMLEVPSDRCHRAAALAQARPGIRSLVHEHRVRPAHHQPRVPARSPLPATGRVAARLHRRAHGRRGVPGMAAGRLRPHRPHQPGCAPVPLRARGRPRVHPWPPAVARQESGHDEDRVGTPHVARQTSTSHVSRPTSHVGPSLRASSPSLKPQTSTSNESAPRFYPGPISFR